jgi:hypothetical protein
MCPPLSIDIGFWIGKVQGMTKSSIASRKKTHDTAICNGCGETCTRHMSAKRGAGWDCLWCGYLTNAEVHSISSVRYPKYSDGTPVRFPDEELVTE